MKTLNFFIIEDDLLYTQLIVAFLETLDAEFEELSLKFETFYSLKEAKFELTQMPDIILMDYLVENDNALPETAMPLIDFLHDIHSEIEVIVISGNADMDIAERLAQLGVKNFIPKDKNTFTKLRSIIEKYI
jgi:response regulator of citrate/malate metabolism